jgi:hypothetical protein
MTLQQLVHTEEIIASARALTIQSSAPPDTDPKGTGRYEVNDLGPGAWLQFLFVRTRS